MTIKPIDDIIIKQKSIILIHWNGEKVIAEIKKDNLNSLYMATLICFSLYKLYQSFKKNGYTSSCNTQRKIDHPFEGIKKMAMTMMIKQLDGFYFYVK